MRFSLAALLAVSASSVITSAQASACASCTTLHEFYDTMKTRMPLSDSNNYSHPSSQIQDDFQTIVGEMMQDAVSCASIDLRSLTGKYSIEVFTDTDNNQDYCVLATLFIQHPWGNVVVNQDAVVAKDLSIDCPHPLHDSNTGDEGIAVFKGTNARSFIVSGSHRKANLGTPGCQSGYYIADAAHTINCFHSAAAAVLDYYEDIGQDYTAIQFHGMSSSQCSGVDAFFTHGTGLVVPQTLEKIDMFRNEMVSLVPAGTFTIPGDQPACTLSGGNNVQGRLINGVHPDDVCTASAAGYTGRFIHLEQKYWLRQNASMYLTWTAALNNAYAQFNVASPPRRVTVTYPNGGETLGQGTVVPITWSSEGVDPSAELHISVGEWENSAYGYKQGIVWKDPFVVNGAGTFDWRIRTTLEEGNYVIRVRKVDETGVVDYSDSTFSMVIPFAITFPNGGETLVKGQSYTIAWDSLAAGVDTVKLSLHKGVSKAWYKNIAVATSNNGSYTFTVPTSWSTGDLFTVRIRNVDYTSSVDYSDAQFSIVN